ncbi:MAG: PIN domain-containing protein [Candidatus Burarchaeum sp.]|nr:PIN domain-containing protein [Candidatus Burarchaeum sp.]MDO8339535.1 PIN domain-containing protein [Candidatus Burarchaeum sp.]
MTDTRVLLDSSVWITYLVSGEEQAAGYAENDEMRKFTCALSLFEIKKKMLGVGIPRSERESKLWFVKSNSEIVDVDSFLCEEAANNAIKHRLSLADAIILTAAQQKSALLVTYDSHFHGISGVRLLR